MVVYYGNESVHMWTFMRILKDKQNVIARMLCTHLHTQQNDLLKAISLDLEDLHGGVRVIVIIS